MGEKSEGTLENAADNLEQKTGVHPRSTYLKLLFNMGQDVLLIVSLLYSVAGVINNTAVPKQKGPNLPQQFFSPGSQVQDYWRGNVFRTFHDASNFENSFVMYYAAWDADCQAARSAMEDVASFFSDTDILVAAVNCWYPTTDCAKEFGQKAHSHPFPVFIFYPKDGKGLQYRGVVSAPHIVSFIRHCRYPLLHVRSVGHHHDLLANHSSLLLGFTPGTTAASLDHNHNAVLLTALSLLEYDPHRDMVVGVVTDPHVARSLHIHSSQPVRLFTWNSTLVYPNKTVDSQKLLAWAVNSNNRPVSWLSLPGRKSVSLHQSLSSGTGNSLLVFTPRTLLQQDPVFTMVRSMAASYSDCNTSSRVRDSLTTLAPRDVPRADVGVGHCRLSSWSYGSEDHPPPACQPPAWTNHSACDKEVFFSDDENVNQLVDEVHRESVHIDHMERTVPDHVVSDRRTTSDDVSKLGCQSNKSLNFFTVDSTQYTSLIGSLGLSDHALPFSVILTPRLESVYLPPSVSESSLQSSLTHLLSSWHQDLVPGSPGFRSSASSAIPSSQDSIIEEVTADNFLSVVSSGDSDVVLLYTSSFCSFCTVATHALHAVAQYFAELEAVRFVMVDATKNDLQWQFSTLTYPVVIVFPKNRSSSSRVFPSKMSINVTNLLSFLVANLSSESRLWLALKHCDEKCLRKTRVSATKSLGELIRLSRRHPVFSARRKIVNKLKFTQTLLHVLTEWEADQTRSPQVSRQYFKQIYDSFALGNQ